MEHHSVSLGNNAAVCTYISCILSLLAYYFEAKQLGGGEANGGEGGREGTEKKGFFF